MDWNWFFSSLSQSAAAIVGIFGAFIITKILSNQTTFSEKKKRVNELIVGAEKIIDNAESLYFEWYNKHTNSRQFDGIEDLLKRGIDEDAERLYDELDFSVFAERSKVVKSINIFLENRKERIAREQEEARRKSSVQKNNFSLGISAISALASPNIPKIPDLHLHGELAKEREAIDRELRNARHHIRLIMGFLDSVKGDPESSPQITYALIMITVLFYIGVIYPLSFMPVPSNVTFELSFGAFWNLLLSLKGGLLAAVSIVFSAALAMFLVINLRMKHSQSDISRLEELTKLGAYSSYFAVREANLNSPRIRDGV